MKSKIIVVSIFPITIFAIAMPLMLSSCSTGGIVFANYESYMSPDLMDKIKDKHSSIKYVSYSTNEDIKAKFKNSYDIAVPSTYTVLELIKDGVLEEINDWTQFNVSSSPSRWNDSQSTQEPIIKYAKPYNSYSSKQDAQNDKENAQCLFSNVTNEIVNSVDDYAHDNHIYGVDKTIFNYALPYFVQNMTFAYHGNAITKLPDPTEHTEADGSTMWYSDNGVDGSPITWNDITNVVGYKKYQNGQFINNDNLDPRFKSSNKSKMAMIDDGRSVYDICHLLYNDQKQKNDININPENEYEKSKSGLNDTYSRLTNKFKRNSFRLNSDSQQVLYSFAAPLKNESNHYAESDAIISYSGDVLYGTMGGGIGDWEDTWDSTNTHVVKPKDTPVMLDMIVMNKKIDKNQSKKQNVYDVIKQSVLDGCDKNWKTSETDWNNHSDDFIGSIDNDGSYRYGTVMNLDYDEYTPPLWNLAKYVSRDEGEYPWDSFYDSKYPSKHDKAELLAQIAEINFEDGLLELPLSNKIKSDMAIVYMQQKEKI